MTSSKGQAKQDAITFEALLAKAYSAASAAQAGKVENMNAFDCGFAWVVVQPATHAFVRYCKAQAKAAQAEADEFRRLGFGHSANDAYAKARRYGSKGYPTGWQFWCPGSFNGQSMPIHEAGARAFRDVVALDPSMGGARVEVGSRYD